MTRNPPFVYFSEVYFAEKYDNNKIFIFVLALENVVEKEKLWLIMGNY